MHADSLLAAVPAPARPARFFPPLRIDDSATRMRGVVAPPASEGVEPCPPSGVHPVARPLDLKTASDADLVLAARAGDPQAARAIWRRYASLVRGKLRASIGADEIEDHVQEVFLRLFERLPQLREPCALRSFLVGIALRVAATELRRRRMRRLRLTADGELPEGAATTTPDYDAKEALARFEALLESLGPHQRRVFELRYVEELELADTAAALGSSLATVKRHLARVSARVFTIVERDAAMAEYGPHRAAAP